MTSDGGTCHAFALGLLRRGVGVKAIGDLLGDPSLEASCAYLRDTRIPGLAPS
jgi:site-specific recombinase XerD